MKILYVEDEPIAREFIQKGLQRHGYLVDVAPDGAMGLELGLSGAYDTIILDVALPDRDGFEVLAGLRRAGIESRVLYLTARGDVADRIRGLDLGADDYLPKPFAFAELLARLRALGRRRTDEPASEILSLDDLILDTRSLSASRAGQRLDLTPKQLLLLEYFLRNQGQVLTRAMIIENVWGYGFESVSNAVDVHVGLLRQKIDRNFEARLLHTVRGSGYILDARHPE